MIQKMSHATIYVIDQDKAKDFYVDKLGFELKADYTGSNGFRWLTVAPKGQSGVSRNERGRLCTPTQIQPHQAAIGTMPRSGTRCCPAPPAASPGFRAPTPQARWQARSVARYLAYTDTATSGSGRSGRPRGGCGGTRCRPSCSAWCCWSPPPRPPWAWPCWRPPAGRSSTPSTPRTLPAKSCGMIGDKAGETHEVRHSISLRSILTRFEIVRIEMVIAVQLKTD